MKEIGILIGRERSFPEALTEQINRQKSGVTAEMVRVGGVSIDKPLLYDVILDRISHDVVSYQPVLKQAALEGARVVNNPFWRIADDKYFGTALARKLGVAVPKTCVLPSKSYPEDVSGDSLRNLQYPLDWDKILEYTGLPAVLKPHWGGGWRDVFIVDSKEALLAAYDGTGKKCMILQEFIQWTQYVRCLCIGKQNVRPAVWDPSKPHHERYDSDLPPLSKELETRVIADSIQLNEALGYDMNTVEYAVRDGVPYAVDFMNSAPDFDLSSLKEENFAWVVKEMADLLTALARQETGSPTYRWNNLMAH